MWHKIQDKKPERDGSYPTWLRAKHSGYEFWHPCTWDNDKFVVEGTLQTPEEGYGWELLAWFDLPAFNQE